MKGLSPSGNHDSFTSTNVEMSLNHVCFVVLLFSLLLLVRNL